MTGPFTMIRAAFTRKSSTWESKDLRARLLPSADNVSILSDRCTSDCTNQKLFITQTPRQNSELAVTTLAPGPGRVASFIQSLAKSPQSVSGRTNPQRTQIAGTRIIIASSSGPCACRDAVNTSRTPKCHPRRLSCNPKK